MTFNELVDSVKKQFDDHPEIVLERDRLFVKITDLFGNSFYISWEKGKCILKKNCTKVCDISIVASQRDIELLFSQKQYLFIANRNMNISGSFTDVMDFHKLLSYITGDNKYIINDEIITKLMMGQDMLKEDLGLVMQSLHLLITNTMANSLKEDIPDFFVAEQSLESQGKSSAESSRRNRAAKGNSSPSHTPRKKSAAKESVKPINKKPAEKRATKSKK